MTAMFFTREQVLCWQPFFRRFKPARAPNKFRARLQKRALPRAYSRATMRVLPRKSMGCLIKKTKLNHLRCLDLYELTYLGNAFPQSKGHGAMALGHCPSWWSLNNSHVTD